MDKATLDRWRFIVDTADGFQGDERGVILFSLVGGSEAPKGSMGFLASDRNRFNVAVSRAQSTLHIFGDRQWAHSCSIPHIRSLVNHIEKTKETENLPMRRDLIGPVWEPMLADGMRQAGMDFEQQYPACGYYLDFAILDPGFKLAIEVDGERYHRDATGSRRLEDTYRDHVLMSAGWEVMRFWVYELKEDFNGCLGRIQQRIEQHRNQSNTDSDRTLE